MVCLRAVSPAAPASCPNVVTKALVPGGVVLASAARADASVQRSLGNSSKTVLCAASECRIRRPVAELDQCSRPTLRARVASTLRYGTNAATTRSAPTSLPKSTSVLWLYELGGALLRLVSTPGHLAAMVAMNASSLLL